MAEADGATPLDPDERAGLRLRHITTRGELDEVEQANIASGLVWIGRRRRKGILTLEAVRALHRRLFGDVWDWAGTFRKTEKNIGIDPAHIPEQLRMLLDDARYWVEHDTYTPVEAAARFHHRMVQIHPFPNGNGRHARIAADLLLEDHFGPDRVDWAAGHDLQSANDRRVRYIAALRAADNGNYGPLFRFVGAD